MYFPPGPAPGPTPGPTPEPTVKVQLYNCIFIMISMCVGGVFSSNPIELGLGDKNIISNRWWLMYTIAQHSQHTFVSLCRHYLFSCGTSDVLSSEINIAPSLQWRGGDRNL